MADAGLLRDFVARAALAEAEELEMLPRGTKVLAAFSGGADSSSLAAILGAASEKLGITLSAYHVNHMIRGAEADRDEEFCRSFCRERGIEFASGHADVPRVARERGVSEELAARDCRYELLVARAREIGADAIALAHNADDNAETILMNLARGAGTRGLAGIPAVGERDGARLVRPLIRVPKAEILLFCARNGIRYVTDSTNNTDSYTRNSIRHNIMPELTRLYPGFLGSASRISDILRAEDEYLDSAARAALGGARISDAGSDATRGNAASVSGLLALPKALRARAIRLYLAESGAPDDSAYAAAAEAVLRSRSPTAEANLPDGKKLRREYDRVYVAFAGERGTVRDGTVVNGTVAVDTLPLEPGESGVFAGKWKITLEKIQNPRIFNDSVNTFFIPCDKIPVVPPFRARAEGDRMTFAGGSKSLRRIMIDKKLPKGERGTLPLLAQCSEVICGPGLGLSADWFVAQGDAEVWKISFERIS